MLIELLSRVGEVVSAHDPESVTVAVTGKVTCLLPADVTAYVKVLEGIACPGFSEYT